MVVPTRSCLVCRRRSPKPSLVRVAFVDGAVVLDPSATLPGRGAYLCHRRACADAALARGSMRLLRALRATGGRTEVDEQRLRAAQSALEHQPAQHEHEGPTSSKRSATGAGVWS